MFFTRETRSSNRVEACARCCVKRLKDVYIVNCSARVNLALGTNNLSQC